MRRWWAASFSVHEARIKRANFMTRVCSLWKASAVYDRPRDDRRHCRRAAADRQSQRRSLNVVGLRDDAAIIPAGPPAVEGVTSPVLLQEPLNWLRVFQSGNAAPLPHGGGQER